MRKKESMEDVINIVFANRKEYDKNRYISRDRYEIELKRAIERFRYVFITGESGSGKTWLAEFYMSSVRGKNNYINLAEVGLAGSLILYLKKLMPEIKTEETTSLGADASIPLISGSGEVTSTYEINNDFLWEFIKTNRNHIIILDNFESIIRNEQILNDISCLITLADDPRMIDYNPKFLIIGTIRDVVKYFQTMPNYQTIANRVRTVGVNGFNDSETVEYVKKGMTKCGFSSNNMTELALEIHNITGGLPQAVNELCYDIAITHFDEGKSEIVPSSQTVYQAKVKWIAGEMVAEYTVIYGYFIENIKKDPLLNYILYSLSEFKMREFSVSEMRSKAEVIIADIKKSLKVSKVREYLDILSDEQNNKNILIKTNADGYKIKSYKTFACISIVLDLDVEKNQVTCVESII